MSNEELQRILEEAEASVRPQETPVESIDDVLDTVTETTQPEVEIQHLDEDDTEDVISDMLSQVGIVMHNSNVPTQNPNLYPEEVTLNAPVSEYVGSDYDEDASSITEEALTDEPAEMREEQENSQDSNSPRILSYEDAAATRESTSRFSGAEWFEIAAQQDITFAGLGGIGSWGAFLLSRIRPRNLFLYDPDDVEFVNMSGQLYGISNVNQAKTAAIATFINNYSDYYDYSTYDSRFTVQSPATNIMISGFDNMEARKTYFNSWMNHVASVPKHQKKECLYIDARMSAEDIQIYCMTGEDDAYMDEYRKECLFSDDEADAHICSYKQTSFCAAMIGALISNLFVNFCTNLGNPLIARPLPFLTSYSASTMFLTVNN